MQPRDQARGRGPVARRQGQPPGRGPLAFTDGETGVAATDDADGTACGIRMRLPPPLLIAESNTGCGGMNVSFTGIYTRRP
ncbi:hypothetical protein [Methylobacterium planeticum]|uniref:Uncharacterized protein n=1 Tax=Methylobacterium planeticum TaxID=2615211 RepID=A0A6N6MUA7_9HYPH|nr:hypothetical protein [Methylobacterium planeticum]KAB1075250.1 hypothetical protein F6X51_04995 [Methylobacterium planeticum]